MASAPLPAGGSSVDMLRREDAGKGVSECGDDQWPTLSLSAVFACLSLLFHPCLLTESKRDDRDYVLV